MKRFGQVASLASRSLLRFGMRSVCPTVIRSFDHDPSAATQGLLFLRNSIYESTGEWNESSLRRVDPVSGRILESVQVEGEFAEGIAFVNERIYQLTWQSGRVLRYSIDPIRKVDERRVNHQGWGMASAGAGLFVSDGSSKIRVYSDEMKLQDTWSIRRFGFPFRHLNAMTIVENSLFANVWNSSFLVQVDLGSRRLVRIIDCSELVRIEGPLRPEWILNGVAFDPLSRTLYLTGKRWRTMFEVELPGI